MNWQQKLAAIEAIVEPITGSDIRVNLTMIECGDWFVSSPSVSQRLRNGVTFGVSGRGATPEAAVEDYWRFLTTPGKETQVVVHEISDGVGFAGSMAVRWDGDEWCPEELY